MRCSFLPQDLYAMFLSQVIFLRQNEPSQALCHLCDLAIKNGNRAMEICNSKCVSNSSQAKWTTESPLQSRCEEHCAIISKQCRASLINTARHWDSSALGVADSPVEPNREMRNRPK